MNDAQRQLALATTGFTLAFALWGQIGALAPLIKQEFDLSPGQVSMLVALPVLLGSIGRIPLGILADLFGGRKVMSILLLLGIIPAIGVASSHSYAVLVGWSLVLGLLGTSFAVGVAFSSKWFPAGKQGAALGVFGMGNIGQSITAFAAPALAVHLGSWHHVPLIFGATCFVWGVLFWAFARDAEAPVCRAGGEAASSTVYWTSPMAWILCLFYFVTFGGFIALSVYLPTLLTTRYGLDIGDAGWRTAGFVAVATLSRPLGGWLADRRGGPLVLVVVFATIFVDALLLVPDGMITFTVGALSFAFAAGVGNGAVFKLVPEHFPAATGTVTGLVGALGGLGGFFPPILLGVLMQATGSYTLGFLGLAIAACGCCFVALRLHRATSPVLATDVAY